MDLDLFSHAEAQAILRRDRGIAMAAAAQDEKVPGFSELAYSHICNLARRHEEIHVDLFLQTFPIKPDHPNAFGAPWLRAKRNRIIEHSGRVRPCTIDPNKNAHLYPVYRSLICEIKP